jgi:hypothetical protein
MLSSPKSLEESIRIKKQYGMLNEQDVNMTSGDITKKLNVGDEIETAIDDDNDEKTSQKDKTQAYRISGGLLVLHGKEQTELELTTDEKNALTSSVDEFRNEVAELTDFGDLNVYPENVEWSGKILELDLEFFFSINEPNGLYVKGDMVKVDQDYMSMIGKLQSYYEKFKAKWSKVVASRQEDVEE